MPLSAVGSSRVAFYGRVIEVNEVESMAVLDADLFRSVALTPGETDVAARNARTNWEYSPMTDSPVARPRTPATIVERSRDQPAGDRIDLLGPMTTTDSRRSSGDRAPIHIAVMDDRSR